MKLQQHVYMKLDFMDIITGVFWSYVIVNHFNFSIIFMGHV